MPFPVAGLGTQTPVRRERDWGSGANGTGLPGGAPGHGRHQGSAPRGSGSRHRKPPERKVRLSRRQRIAAGLALAVGTLCVGLVAGFGSEASAEPTVQAFLLAWQQGKYAQAAALTDGDPGQVAAELAAAHTDLGATNTFMTMGPVRQHGPAAVADFEATVDLAQAGQQWTYTGRFGLTSAGGRWIVHWTPSVINPDLAPGDRLAVVTTFPPRAQVEDMNGSPLMAATTDYRIGVYPGRLADAAATAARFGQLAGVNGAQVLGHIRSAPPGEFLSLLTLEPAAFRSLWPRLSRVQGLRYQQGADRLAASLARETVGEVGTENASELRAEGVAYQPGMTVGLSGLQQAYQDQLTGTPTTSVVAVDPAGRAIATLWSSRGHQGTPLRTTLSSQNQAAADAALAGQPDSGELVAVDVRTGAIRALASRQAGAVGLPAGGVLNGQVAPGMAFSIVSAAALLSAGVSADQPLACKPVTYVGGVPFTYQAAASATDTFASDFAAGCGTAFAQMSRTLTPGQLTAAERGFGIGGAWHLAVPAFSGSAAAVSGAADMAAQAIGQSGVLMSPLGMALVAAEVATGTGHAPVLVAGGRTEAWRAPLTAGMLGELRQLMRQAVASGSAHAADVPGTAVYGQSGIVRTGKNAYLSWFVGYRGDLAVAAVETGTSASQAAASLAGAFWRAAR